MDDWSRVFASTPDPGVGIFLVAAGGLMLLVAILITATGTSAALRR